ncbi:hypothetical protein LguiA_035392 [Lonicera macranthoides]
MPRSRGSEVPQRQSPRGPPLLRTSSSNSDPLHNRPPITDRSPKLGGHRSPRGSHSDSVNQKKLGTRIAGLESQLEQAQEELKILKHQLDSAEAAKKQAQQELQKNATNAPIVQESVQLQKETYVFEVPVEKMPPKSKVDFTHPTSESPVILKTIKPSLNDLVVKNDEIDSLRSKIEEKEKELEVFGRENKSLKSELNGATLELSLAQAKKEETNLRLKQLEEELKASKGNVSELNKKVEEVEGVKVGLESEMKKLKVQTEQWRKAADAAAAILAGGVDMNGGIKVSERRGSMDNKRFGVGFEPHVGNYGGYLGSPGFADDSDDGFEGGKRKGIRMFGDLWKKKGQK